jgi:hypothetical protein
MTSLTVVCLEQRQRRANTHTNRRTLSTIDCNSSLKITTFYYIFATNMRSWDSRPLCSCALRLGTQVQTVLCEVLCDHRKTTFTVVQFILPNKLLNYQLANGVRGASPVITVKPSTHSNSNRYIQQSPFKTVHEINLICFLISILS